MGPARGVIARAAWRVARATAGETVGRAVNLVLPIALLAVHPADVLTDTFFVAMAVAFFVHGTLANALVTVFVPELVNDRCTRGLAGYLCGCGLVGAFAGLAAYGVAAGPLGFAPSLVAAASVAVMAAAGLAAAPAVAVLNGDHRYGVAGLAWLLRVLPVAAYVLVRPDATDLPWLLGALALADAGRAAVLLRLTRDRLVLRVGSTSLRFPHAAMHLVAASAAAGLVPLIARAIAAGGSQGGVSLFEAADRLYGAVASLATIGLGNVALVYLARLTGTPDESRGWRLILWISVGWSAAWVLASLAIWAALPAVVGWFEFASADLLREAGDLFLALALGLPGFIVTNLLARRLVTRGLSRAMLPMALVSVAFVGAAGSALAAPLGPLGIAVALTLNQYLMVLLMTVKLRRAAADAHPRPV